MRTNRFTAASLPPAPLPFAVRQALQPSAALAPGFAMIELVAIATVSAMLTAVAWGGYQRSAERRTVASEADTIATIARNTARTYASRGDYGALTQSSAVAQGIFPARLITGNGSVANAVSACPRHL